MKPQEGGYSEDFFIFYLILCRPPKIGSYLGGGAKEAAGPEEAGRRGADGGRVGAGSSSDGALLIDGLVGGDHGSGQLKAAVVAVVFDQGQRVVLF